MIDECNRRVVRGDILANRRSPSGQPARPPPEPAGSYLEELVGLWADPRVAELTTLRVPQPRRQVLEMVKSSRIWWEEDGLGPFDAIERETGAWVGRVGLWRLSDWAGPERYEVASRSPPRSGGEGTRARRGERPCASASRTACRASSA